MWFFRESRITSSHTFSSLLLFLLFASLLPLTLTLQDFKIVNIFVPKANVRDTVDLFRLPNRRMISLRFLAAYVININRARALPQEAVVSPLTRPTLSVRSHVLSRSHSLSPLTLPVLPQQLSART